MDGLAQREVLGLVTRPWAAPGRQVYLKRPAC